MLNELRQRNVHRVALAYLAGAWLLIQIVETLTPDFLPAVVFRTTVIFLAIGFVPALILAWKFEWTAEGLRREKIGPAGTARTDSPVFDRVVTVTLLLAVTYFAVDKFIFDPARDAAEIEAVKEEVLTTALIESFGARSIVVLPFANMSSDPEQEYFADGITEELLNLLAQISELRVISRSTAWTFKGEKIDIPAIQKKLNVSHILEGSVRKAGDKIRITAQLIDARTDTHIWSETYDKTLDDIFNIQDEISSHIVSELKLELLDGMPEVIEIDPRAYQMFLQARFITNGYLSDRYDEAEQLLIKVLKLEPEFVPAIWHYTRMVGNKADQAGNASELAQAEAEVDKLVARMVELAPTSSYTNGWLGLLADIREHDLQKAAHHYELAVAGGTDTNTWFQLSVCGRFMSRLGRHDEAVEIFNYVLSRDPACAGCLSLMARSFRESGRHREGAEKLEEILEWHPPSPNIYWALGVSWLVAGETEKALDYFTKQGSPVGDNLGRLLALHSLGRQQQFSEEFTMFRELNQENPEAMARTYAWTGQNDLAFEWLDKMVEQFGSEKVFEVKTELYNPIKTDPRWQAFLEKHGAEDQDLSWIVFDPKLPDVNWRPAEIRPASSP